MARLLALPLLLASASLAAGHEAFVFTSRGSPGLFRSTSRRQRPLSAAFSRGAAAGVLSPYFSPFDELERAIDRAFTAPAATAAAAQSRAPHWARGSPLGAVTVASSASEFTISMDLPGVRKDDVSVTVEDDVLTIEASRRSGGRGAAAAKVAEQEPVAEAGAEAEAEAAAAGDGDAGAPAEVAADGSVDGTAAPTPAPTPEAEPVATQRQERYFGSVRRQFSLPAGELVRVEGMTANLEDGVLTVRIPRVEQEPKAGPRVVTVQ